MQDTFDKQHKRHKYHALERIGLLVDPGTFREVGSQRQRFSNRAFATSQPNDGVITGRGKVNGKLIYIFAQDFTVMGGSIGKVHGEKIRKLIEMAVQNRAPVIGIYDSVGARIEEGVCALGGCGDILSAISQASGIVPQISVVVGACAGAAAYAPALTDFVYMVKNIGYMFVTGAEVVQSVTGESCTNQDLGGAKVHVHKSGVAHFFEPNEKACFKDLRKLIDYLPSSFDGETMEKEPSYVEKIQDVSGRIPQNSHEAYDMRTVIEEIADKDSFIEVAGEYAESVIVGFLKLSSLTVGVLANQPLVNSGALDLDVSDKASRFIRFCDAFRIPLVSLVDTPGYLPGIEQEHHGIIRHGAKLIYAYTEATIPKITIILRKAYGGAYIAMGSKHLKTDYNYALSTAEIAVMGAKGAVGILHKKKMKEMEEDVAALFFRRKADEYKRQFMNPKMALEEGYLDEIIQPNGIRKRVFEDIVSLKNKVSHGSDKKHGNMPL